ncbi:MAG: hypothetical protein ACREGG_03590 [Candidatus Saccharimonadales bacterium]
MKNTLWDASSGSDSYKWFCQNSEAEALRNRLENRFSLYSTFFDRDFASELKGELFITRLWELIVFEKMLNAGFKPVRKSKNGPDFLFKRGNSLAYIECSIPSSGNKPLMPPPAKTIEEIKIFDTPVDETQLRYTGMIDSKIKQLKDFPKESTPLFLATTSLMLPLILRDHDTFIRSIYPVNNMVVHFGAVSNGNLPTHEYRDFVPKGKNVIEKYWAIHNPNRDTTIDGFIFLEPFEYDQIINHSYSSSREGDKWAIHFAERRASPFPSADFEIWMPTRDGQSKVLQDRVLNK